MLGPPHAHQSDSVVLRAARSEPFREGASSEGPQAVCPLGLSSASLFSLRFSPSVSAFSILHISFSLYP